MSIETKRIAIPLGVALLMPQAAWAECLGSNCYGGLGWMLAGIVAATIVGLTVLIVAARKLGRRFGIWNEAGFVVLVGAAFFTFLALGM